MLSYSRNLAIITQSLDLIIGFSSPVNPMKLVTKRIIAMENDIVQTRRTHPFQKFTVPTGHLWVEGDEAYHSKDSNDYGPVSSNFNLTFAKTNNQDLGISCGSEDQLYHLSFS